MIVKLLSEHHFEFLSLEGGCRGSSESTHIKMSNRWKSPAAAHIIYCRADLQGCDVYSTSNPFQLLAGLVT